MFQPRSSAFSDPRLTAIVDHLRAIERELAAIGRKAGRRASTNASAAGDLIADTVGPILNDIADRFWRGPARRDRRGRRSRRPGGQNGRQGWQ